MLKTFKTVILIIFFLQIAQTLTLTQRTHQSSAITSTKLQQINHSPFCDSQTNTDSHKNCHRKQCNAQKQSTIVKADCLQHKSQQESKKVGRLHLQSMNKCSGATPVWNGKECKACPTNSFFSAKLNFCVVCVPGTVFNKLAQRCVIA